MPITTSIDLVMPPGQSSSVHVSGTTDPTIHTNISGSLQFSVTRLAPDPPTPGLVPPAVTPTTETGDPYNPQFDKATLPGLLRFPAPVHILSHDGIRLEVVDTDGTTHDLSDCVTEWSTEEPLAGTWFGTVDLIRVGDVDLNPISSPKLWRLGNRVNLTLLLGSTEHTICRDMHLVERPDFRALPGGGQSSAIRVGDLFRNLEGRPKAPSEPYCGPRLGTAGEQAAIWLERWTGRRHSFPKGVTLIEPIDDPPSEDRAYDAIADLMKASALLVRTSNTNRIVVEPRPRFDASTATTLNLDELLQPPSFNAGGRIPFSSAEGYSRGVLQSRPTRSVIRTRRYPVGYNENDFRPYVFGGVNWFEDVRTVFLGEVVVYERVQLFGRYPTSATVTDTGGTTSVCNDDGTGAFNDANTEFGLIKTTITSVDAVAHSSGKFLIQGRETVEDGFTWLESGGTYNRFPASGTTTLRREIEESSNQAIPDGAICPDEYTHFVSLYEYRLFEIISPEVGLDLRESKVEDNYQISEASQGGRTLGQPNAWYRRSQEGSYLEEYEQFIWGPPLQERISPPESEWINWVRTDIQLNGIHHEISAISDKYGASHAGEVQMPFVYTVADAQRWLDLYLREQAGDYGSVSIALPWTRQVARGDSVSLEVSPGVYQNYIVDYVSMVGDGASAELAIRLSEEFEE